MSRPLPVMVEPAKEADIPALSLQARSVGLSPSPSLSDSPAASPALLAFDYQPIPKGYRLPARSPSPFSVSPPDRSPDRYQHRPAIWPCFPGLGRWAKRHFGWE